MGLENVDFALDRITIVAICIWLLIQFSLYTLKIPFRYDSIYWKNVIDFIE